ncbi:hypothetical protein KIN20_013318 [Parelaphostrongylus tenuis]|uniref:Uncharacterized protein n=1 Tax=Parelaphostrongylus tenuis TaxID=148309 RepID=A0AAD5MVY1_PARTN|nr:hypothetical protein KIN20_013318 [Parelaphostrongylus tenuis]
MADALPSVGQQPSAPCSAASMEAEKHRNKHNTTSKTLYNADGNAVLKLKHLVNNITHLFLTIGQ